MTELLQPNLPPHIACVVLTQQDQGDNGVLPEELEVIPHGMSESRKSQFRLGRRAAHLALEKLGKRDREPILRGSRGDPLWPAGYVGSITHSSGIAIAAAASSDRVKLLGIDLQDCRKPLRHNIAKHICTEAERKLLSTDPNERDRVVLKLFSVKESVFKAYYPLLKRYIGFQEVSLTWNAAEDHFEGTFHKLDRGLNQRHRTFAAPCEAFRDYIFTSVLVASG
jgi:enterobactin synthetase component D